MSDKPGIGAELTAVRDLPVLAQQALWQLVEPNIAAIIGDGAEEATRRFCDEHGLTIEQVVPVVRGMRKLLRQAAALDLPVEEVHNDVLSMTQDRDVARRVAACYDRALPALRAEAILASVERFGPVLLDFGLRMDHVPVSRNAAEKMVPIALVSLPYRDGAETKRLTLQVTPALLRKMKLMLDAAVG